MTVARHQQEPATGLSQSSLAARCGRGFAIVLKCQMAHDIFLDFTTHEVVFPYKIVVGTPHRAQFIAENGRFCISHA
ncbi:hypothetical protein C6558_12735 [Ensifer sp. NM-2]|nr:hypothetical protein C6558_12735 [Ensifer sp. NM-2]